jgi:Leucine-rich repeat (LRR) protein
VRVLDLTGTGIIQLPENIGKLKHVRYLGLPGTISSNLCDQVTKLLFLQTLAVGDKSNTEKKRECITNISGIGRLVKLRESIEFKVMRASEKEGHGVSELAGMNSLGETLTIKGLDAISSKEEAEEAQLGRKVSVKILKLEWGAPDLRQFADGPSSRTSEAAAADPAVAVLEGLQPHGYIQDLRITRYPGETSPTWFSGLQKLTRLYLRNCRRLQALPALGALPCLEILDIKELTAVVKINGDFCGDGAFLKLKKIVLDDMEKLVAWDDMPKHAFPVLREVRIKDCPRLSSLSGLGCCGGPIDLRVEGCPSITQVNQLPANFNGGNFTCKFY